ncbi:MAG: aminotransferase class I/II-fold pyridoxal phosphate-dependent enzyme [Acidimicrobiales bacterium]|nr:aminotransferase class I/II-fold pyridoxal phosphate-dependent enzyme [Acidimicrobiales bacterium]
MSGWKIPLAIPNVGAEEARAVHDAIMAGDLAIGREQEHFERFVTDITGAKFAVSVSSGTAALHLALLVLGIGPGDTVVVPDLTFIASVNPISYVGATPVLIDVKPDSGNIDVDLITTFLEDLQKEQLPLPKAIVAVHLLGEPCDMEGLMSLSKEYGIDIIEDAAESLGATYGPGSIAYKSTGSIGKIGIISFNGNKVVTTGGGGMLLTNDGALASKARHLSTQARLAGNYYNHDVVGYNYRMSNISATLGIEQLKKLREFISAKRSIYRHYQDSLELIGDIKMMDTNPENNGTCWLSTALFQDKKTRVKVEAHLRNLGIECRALWTPIHLQTPYRDSLYIGTGVSSNLADCALSLPSSTSLKESEQREVIDVVISTLINH